MGLRIYLETTVFNYYFDAPRVGHEDVVRLFEAIGAGVYEAYTSPTVVRELRNAPQPRRDNLLGLLDEYGVMLLTAASPRAKALAARYVAEGILTDRHRVDGLHIAEASVAEMDCIVSYNFQHINRRKTKTLTARINRREGYGGVVICTAEEVLRYGDRLRSGDALAEELPL
ncbi:MAG: PIN domain-containing protein [Synergistaceae bacterium]|jgi:predicted nucleic acid-binding protein|nr:PIN domain-containing protein [Synergistaceae bacterium]